MNSAIRLKEEIGRTKDEETLLELNNKLQLQIKRMEKLKEYSIDIHETFRTIPLRSERLQQAEEYFYQGKFPEMDEILDAAKIREEIEQLEETRFSTDEAPEKETKTGLECKSYELIIKALYHYTLVENPGWRDDVYELLSDARDASFNIHAMYELGTFLKNTDEQEWAHELLDDAIVICHGTEGKTARLYEAKSLWAMGMLSANKKDLTKTIEYLGKAVKIYTDLSETNPDEYRQKTSDMLVALSRYHIYAKNLPVAIVVLEEAIKIRRRLAVLGDWECSMNLADALDKLATVHVCMQEYREACQLYQESIDIKEKNIDRNLYMILESKANTLYNLAVAYYNAKEYEKAIPVLQEELAARKQVQEIDPFGQLPLRAKSRDMLGDIYLKQNRPEDAIREKEKVVKLYRTLSDRFPEEYLINLGESINHCCSIYSRTKSNDKYFQSTLESLEIFRRLAVTDPKEYLPIVACLLGNLCYCYQYISPDREKTLENAREAYRILSSIKRNETSEQVYTIVKQILGQK
jgi:tetratricopeptide (TPR) repeat protein